MTLGVRGVDRERFKSADTFEEYLAGVEKNRELWHDVYERARVSDEIISQVLAGIRGRVSVGTI